MILFQKEVDLPFGAIIIQMIQSNIFGSSRYLKDPYNYESNLIGNVRMRQLLNIIEMALQVCPDCQIRKKNHYCIELSCSHRELICPQCDVNRIDRTHYLHDYSYLVPFLTKDIFSNFYKIKKKITNFHEDVTVQIKKIEEYLKELYKVESTVKNQIQLLELEEERGKIKNYLDKMTKFIANYSQGQKLKEELDDVMFLSAQQCQKKQDQMKNEIIACLDSLKWPKDPQRVLKQKLKQVPEDEKKQIFISMFKSVEVNEIDSLFKANSEFLTESLKNHQVQIKLDSDMLGKPKFFQSFIFHFRDCQRLFIDNGNINHLRTPLTFRNLKSLEFNFNLEAEPQNIKMDVSTEQLRELTMRRFREEDLKILKQIVAPCTQLKKLHIQFSNKVDLYCYKELIQFLKQDSLKALVSFTLKIRTEGEVKRLYGYLSKFSKDPVESETNLNKQLIQLVESNPCLTKFVVEGVRPLEMPMIVNKLKKLTYLMDYRMYFENVDLMTEVEDRESKYLEVLCGKRRRTFYMLAKASKNKYFSRAIVNHIVSEYLI